VLVFGRVVHLLHHLREVVEGQLEEELVAFHEHAARDEEEVDVFDLGLFVGVVVLHAVVAVVQICVGVLVLAEQADGEVLGQCRMKAEYVKTDSRIMRERDHDSHTDRQDKDTNTDRGRHRYSTFRDSFVYSHSEILGTLLYHPTRGHVVATQIEMLSQVHVNLMRAARTMLASTLVLELADLATKTCRTLRQRRTSQGARRCHVKYGRWFTGVVRVRLLRRLTF
jgi:hypothetical protein